MGLLPVQTEQKKKGGKGGLFGKIFGGLAGAVGGFFAGGPAGAVTGAGLGSKLGGTVGTIADPGKIVGGQGVPTLETAAKLDPEVQLANLVDAQKQTVGTAELSEPQKTEVLGVLNPAIAALQRNLKPRVG